MFFNYLLFIFLTIIKVVSIFLINFFNYKYYKFLLMTIIYDMLFIKWSSDVELYNIFDRKIKMVYNFYHKTEDKWLKLELNRKCFDFRFISTISAEIISTKFESVRKIIRIINKIYLYCKNIIITKIFLNLWHG